jgi:methionyl aminopeptidase
VQDISRAIQSCVETNRYNVVREFVGHGVGRNVHEKPEVPNFVDGKPSPRLRPGMTLAIEPMVNAGAAAVKLLNDGWTVVTKDRRPSVHFEHVTSLHYSVLSISYFPSPATFSTVIMAFFQVGVISQR